MTPAGIDPDLAPRQPWSDPVLLVAVLVGGLVGTLARYGLDVTWPTPTGGFPWVTFVINASGALALGALLAAIGRADHPPRWLRPLFGTGLLGGWTTYSTLMVEVAVLGKGGDVGTGALYLAASLVAGLTAVVVGKAGVALLWPRRVVLG